MDDPDGELCDPGNGSGMPCATSAGDGPTLDLARIQLADQAQFSAVFAALKQPISDYSFANTYIWGASLKLYWARLAGHLCVFANGTGDLTMLMPPLPEAGADEADLRHALEDCFDIMDRYNDRCPGGRQRSRIEYVSDELLEHVSAAKAPRLSATPMGGDYVYDMARTIDLAGGALKSKRHGRSKFLRQFPDHSVHDLADEHVPRCLRLLSLWQRHGDQSHEGEVNDAHLGSDILRHRDTLACQRALQFHKELGLRGMVLMVADELVGFTLGEALGADQASILIEKTHPDFHGAPQFIFSEFCRRYWSTQPRCNVGDDWGIPSLRFTKQSYRPIRLLSKYTLARQGAPVVGFRAPDVPATNPRHTVEPSAGSAPAAVGAAGEVAPAPVLRRARPGDLEGLLELERACFRTLEETFNRRQVRALIANPRATVTVAEVGGQVAGWSVGLVRQHRRHRSGRLYAVAVHPRAQGRQIGQQLVEHTLLALAGLGIKRVYLEVRADNEPAINLYRKLGFTDRGVLPNYYGTGRHGRRMARPWGGGPATRRPLHCIAGASDKPVTPTPLRG